MVKAILVDPRWAFDAVEHHHSCCDCFLRAGTFAEELSVQQSVEQDLFDRKRMVRVVLSKGVL